MVASKSHEYGRLAFVGNEMIAVLVQEDGQTAQTPRWAIDWLAPGINGRPPQFTEVESARIWLSHRYRSSRTRGKPGSQ
jgi:hypothetical protein